MSTNSIIIIGGGISGLALGSYLQMNGYSTSIFEKNGKCGGVSFAWKRGAYTFDGATNWLAGSGPSANLHGLLAELIDFNELQILDSDEFATVEYKNEILHVYCDADRLQHEMLRIAPVDESQISRFTKAIKKVSTFKLPYGKAPELYTLLDYCTFIFSQLPFILFFSRWKRITLGQFAQGFTNPVLRTLFLKIFPRHEHFSVFSLIVTLGWMNCKSGGYPVGGSRKLIELLEKKYSSLGGTLYTHSPVRSIIIDKNHATGISLENGTIYQAAKTVATVDLLYTMQTLLGSPPCLNESIHSYTHFPLFPSLIQISLGIRRVFTGVPHKIMMQLDDPIDLGDGGVLDEMMVRICNFDPTFAPKDATSVIVHIRTPHYHYWSSLREQQMAAYQSIKKVIAERVIETLEKRFGNIKASIDELDIATPATFNRYTNIFKGSYQGWAPTPELIGKTLPKTFKSIKNFYVSGQWVWPAGGIPGVIRITRQTAQIICHDDRKPFSVRVN